MRASDGILVLLGGVVFGVLFHSGFPGSSTLREAVAVGLVVMAPAVVAHRVLGEQSTLRFLFVALLAGMLIGLGIWWLTARSFPWFLFAGPAGVLALTVAAFERLAEKILAGRGRSSTREK